MKRLDFEVYGCLIAEFVACRSEDKQTKVGGVLLNSKTKKLISTGYNGLKQNQNWPIRWDDIENRLEKAGLIIHCEQNLFNHNSCDKGPFTVCLNLSPCESCMKLLVGQNVRKIVFLKEYRDWEKSKKICDFYDIEYRILNSNDINNMIYWVKFVLTKLENLIALDQDKAKPETVKKHKSAVPEVGAKYKIREGAQVGMDMQFWIWPNLPNGDVDKVFVCDDVFHSGRGRQASCRLKAYKFGSMSGEGYGNGAITVNFKDMISI